MTYYLLVFFGWFLAIFGLVYFVKLLVSLLDFLDYKFGDWAVVVCMAILAALIAVLVAFVLKTAKASEKDEHDYTSQQKYSYRANLIKKIPEKPVFIEKETPDGKKEKVVLKRLDKCFKVFKKGG